MCIYPYIYIHIYIYTHIYIYIYDIYIYIHTHPYTQPYTPPVFFFKWHKKGAVTSLLEEDLDAVKSSYDSVASLLARNSRYLHENPGDFEPKNNKKKHQTPGNLLWKAADPLIGREFLKVQTWRNFKRWSDVQWFLRKIFWWLEKSVGIPRGNFEGSILSFGRPADASRSSENSRWHVTTWDGKSFGSNPDPGFQCFKWRFFFEISDPKHVRILMVTGMLGPGVDPDPTNAAVLHLTWSLDFGSASNLSDSA